MTACIRSLASLSLVSPSADTYYSLLCPPNIDASALWPRKELPPLDLEEEEMLVAEASKRVLLTNARVDLIVISSCGPKRKNVRTRVGRKFSDVGLHPHHFRFVDARTFLAATF